MSWRKCERPGGDVSCGCVCKCCQKTPLHRAAPELLAAAREAQEFLAGLVFGKEMEVGEGIPLRKLLADAIAKAEGR